MTAALDQASRLRALVHDQRQEAAPDRLSPPVTGPATHAPARAEGRRAHVIAIASGKGGVGKTSLAVNLAICMARSGRDTVLFDGDFGLGNADMLCGLPPGRHLGSVLSGERAVDDVAARFMPGMRLIPCGSGVAGLADPDAAARRRLAETFEMIARSAEIVLIDCGAGLGPVVLNLVAAADTTLIVTTPEPTAIADAYGLIKSSISAEPRPSPGVFRLVVNQCRSRAEGESVHARIAAVCDRFLGYRLPLAGTVLADSRVGQAVRDRRPLLLTHPRSDAARDVLSLSGSLLRLACSESLTVAASGGAWSRLWRIIARTG